MWCWINDEYNQLRIFTYYMPIWTCIVLSTLIYVAVGYHVFHQRNQLRNLTLSNQARDPSGAEPRTTEKVRPRKFQRLCNFYLSLTKLLKLTAFSLKWSRSSKVMAQ